LNGLDVSSTNTGYYCHAEDFGGKWETGARLGSWLAIYNEDANFADRLLPAIRDLAALQLHVVLET
jgi:hypothetical protein